MQIMKGIINMPLLDEGIYIKTILTIFPETDEECCVGGTHLDPYMIVLNGYYEQEECAEFVQKFLKNVKDYERHVR